ncbi:MAG: hypothetical protein ABIE55_02600 [Candidatus Aenigmatarchaeota archaeon]
MNYQTQETQSYVNDPKWNKEVSIAVEMACLRGDIKSVESNPLARKLALEALNF